MAPFQATRNSSRHSTKRPRRRFGTIKRAVARTIRQHCAVNRTYASLHRRRLASIAILTLSAGMSACQHSTSERWIFPAGYVGWARLDYSVKGPSALSLDHGRYMIRVPRSGRVATSTVNNPSVDDNQYFTDDAGSLRKMRFAWVNGTRRKCCQAMRVTHTGAQNFQTFFPLSSNYLQIPRPIPRPTRSYTHIGV